MTFSSQDLPLDVKIVDGMLAIRGGIKTLAFAVTAGEKGFRVTEALVAADDILRELRREQEDGTTVVHEMLDRAALAAWENGGEGFSGVDEDDE